MEIVKERAYNADDKSAVYSLMLTIETFLKLLAPFCPFIAEEVYQCRPWGMGEGSVHKQPWPTLKPTPVTDELYETVVVLVEGVRKAKADAKKSLRTPVKELIVSGKSADMLEQARGDIINVTKSLALTLNKSNGDLSIDGCELVLEETPA